MHRIVNKYKPLWFISLIALAFLIAACGTSPQQLEPDAKITELATLSISSQTTKSELEATYGATVIAFQPEAGFAILGLSEHHSGLTALATSPNAPVKAPTIVSAAGSSAWGGGSTAWGGGSTAWGGGWSAWGGGWSAWGGGTSTVPALPSENRYMFMQSKVPQGQVIARNYGNGIKIAVIDTGLDLSHPMFSGRLAASTEWKDFIDGDTTPQEVSGTFYGHGTGIAGLVLQIAPKAKILPIRVLGPDGGGDVANVISAIDWAIQKGANVINLSLGTTENVASFQTMINYATSLGVYITASAGNTGDSNVTYPAAWAKTGTNAKYLLSVGSVGQSLLLSIFSCSGTSLEFVAPGEYIYSAYPGSMVAMYSGTSFATPQVAGTLALALSDTAASNKGNLESYLLNSDIPVGSYGLINTVGFLQQLPDVQRKSALFIHRGASPSTSDQTAIHRLQSLGYNVTNKEQKVSATSDATGKHLVVISSSVGASDVNTKFRDVAVPVVVWEAELFDDMKMTGTTLGTNMGTISSQNFISTTGSGHPLSGGFTALPLFTAYSSLDVMTYGVPSSSATKIATLYGDSSRSVIFGYNTSDTMVGMNAPARRVGFFLNDAGPSKLTSAGWQLFEAAVTWAASGN